MTPQAAAGHGTCGRCRLDAGFVYTEIERTVDGRVVPDVVRERCDHGRPDADPPASTPDEARDASLAGMDDAEQLSRAVEVIRLAAVANATVSANTVRADMDAADVPKPMRGLAFRRAIGKGFIRPAGFEPSTHPDTHAHPVRVYESLRFTGGAW